MEAAADRFLDHLRVERNLSPRTLAAYGRDLTGLRDFLRQDEVHTPRDVRLAHLSGWLRSMASRGLKGSSQARALSAVRQFFAYLVREGQLDEDPSQLLNAPRRRRPLPVVPSQNETKRLVEAPAPRTARGQRDRAALELLYAAGLRASELCGLRLDELHLGLGVVRPRGKGAKERVVPIGAPALEALQCYLADGRLALLKGKPSPYVFIGNRSKPLSRMGLYKLIQRYAVAAGIDRKLSPHKLRHAFATHLLQGGADLRVVQEMLGHADISTTEIYTHVDTEQLQKTIDTHHPLGDAGKGAPR